MTPRALAGALVYALVVFAVGFAIGTLRVLVVEPRLGPVLSVAIEIPIMLAVSWLAAHPIVRRTGAWEVFAAAKVGLVGVMALIALETLLGLAFGQPVFEQVAAYATMRGMLTLVGQAGFALMPVLVSRKLRTPESAI